MTSRSLKGVFRSLRLYQGPDAPRARMDALYARFLSAGDLAFDIGAHVGDRVSSFRRLGARVVALEPQPLAMRALRLIHGRDAAVRLIPAAAAARSGSLQLKINTANPTVSTASAHFIADADGATGWEGQVWDDEITVPAVTLDELIAQMGRPSFIKIDVEGFEDEVLAGLTQPVAALSFEFTTIARDVALRGLARLSALGEYRYDVAMGETQILNFEKPLNGDDMAHFLKTLPHSANSGDIYACLVKA